jgi:hypothetical protein
MIRTREEWEEWCFKKGTSGDMVYAILSDWKESVGWISVKDKLPKDNECVLGYMPPAPGRQDDGPKKTHEKERPGTCMYCDWTDWMHDQNCPFGVK